LLSNISSSCCPWLTALTSVQQQVSAAILVPAVLCEWIH
jgi:hypothetical protein